MKNGTEWHENKSKSGTYDLCAIFFLARRPTRVYIIHSFMLRVRDVREERKQREMFSEEKTNFGENETVGEIRKRLGLFSKDAVLVNKRNNRRLAILCDI